MTDLLRKRGKAVRIVAFVDLADTIFELIYSEARLLKHSEAYESKIFYDFMGQSFMFPIGLYLLLIVQGIVAIRLFGATKDANSELWLASKKCLWWQRVSYLLLFFLLLELFVLLYSFITQIYNVLTFLTLVICLGEICFRICGIFIVSKFLKTITLVPTSNIVPVLMDVEVLQVQSGS